MIIGVEEMKKTSLADIAGALGVSKTLVSMVLNGQGDLHGINVDTQKRVLEKAKELNYKPNRMARGLRTGTTNTLGLIVADIANPFYAKIARAVEDYASKKGYHLMFASSDEDDQREKDLIEMLVDRQVDGLIIATTLSADSKKTFEELKKSGPPFVLIDRYIDGLESDIVVGNNEKGAYDLTTHLLSKGHQKIALLTVSPSHLSSINDRIKGYKKALKENGKSSPEIIYNIPYTNVEGETYKALDEITKSKSVDAIFTLNNNLATSCVKYFKHHHISIPKDIAFASYDNVEWFEYANPSITGVAQPITEIGEKAVELLLSRIKSKKSDGVENILLESTVVIRESSH